MFRAMSHFPSRFLPRTLLALAGAALLAGGIHPAALARPVADEAQPTELPAEKRPQVERPRIEVAFVLDTTGSMGGLIAGAKQKIWAIANQMMDARPTPDIRIGLIGYRDRSDDYVTKRFDLTDDIDEIYKHLTAFNAGGGGDTPESVNQALHEAVTELSWSDDDDVLKIIFLVGDAPPQMGYEQDVKYPESCEAAVKAGLIINTVQCGQMASTTPIWKEIARLAEGDYTRIGQTGDVVVASTPYDEDLARLNRELGETIVTYGDESRRRELEAKQEMSEDAPAAVAADRLEFNAKAGRVVGGGKDLVEALADGEADLDDIADEELPEPMQAMTAEQREQYVKEQSEKRAGIRKQIDELVARRRAFVEKREAELRAKTGKTGFDAEVNAMLRSQAARKGIEFKDEPAPAE